MRKLIALWRRLRGSLLAERSVRDLDAEIESHVQMHTDDNIRAGMDPVQARRAALLAFGSIEPTRQAYRERGVLPELESFVYDIRYAVRQLRRSPGFAFVALITLAIGIGANAALFSIVSAVLLHPLPYTSPEELVAVHASKPNFEEGSISYPNFLDWRREDRTLASFAISRAMSFRVSNAGEDPERVRGNYISSNFFAVLGVQPVQGRLFAAGEDLKNGPPVALISADLWARRFGSKLSVLGRPLLVDGRVFTIVGVIPSSFALSIASFRPADVYLPIGQWQTTALTDRGAGLGIHGIARLKPGVTLEQAQTELNGLSDRLAAQFPEDDHSIRGKLVPLRQAVVGQVRPALLILMTAVGFVLLIACVNVANLLLARSTARKREFAVRFALGASPVRVVRQLVTESVMLALAGGTLGLLLAAACTRSALKLAPTALPRSSEVHLNASVLLFTFAASLAAGFLFGLLPAWRMAQRPLGGSMREGGRGQTSGSGAQNVLVAFEMAAAVVLLASAGLMIRSLVALSSVDPGFQSHGVLTLSISAPYSPRTATPEAVRAYLREVDDKLVQVPGVQAASVSWGAFPLSNDDEQLFWLQNESKPANTSDMHWSIRYRVEPDFLKVMRIPLLRGRFFSDADREQTPHVAVIDEAFAEKYFGGTDPIGHSLNLNDSDQPVTIVGVSQHIMQWGLDNDSINPLRAEIYVPFAQLKGQQLVSTDGMSADVIVRATDANAAFPAIQGALHAVDNNLIAYAPETMDEIIGRALATKRFLMWMLGGFATIALLLACIGMYGVIAYLVTQRTPDIAVRMALGATRTSVLGWVMRQGLTLGAIGMGVGLALSLLSTRLLAHASVLYGVHFYDPLTLLAVLSILLLVMSAACYVPARRATRVAPAEVLRGS